MSFLLNFSKLVCVSCSFLSMCALAQANAQPSIISPWTQGTFADNVHNAPPSSPEFKIKGKRVPILYRVQYGIRTEARFGEWSYIDQAANPYEVGGFQLLIHDPDQVLIGTSELRAVHQTRYTRHQPQPVTGPFGEWSPPNLALLPTTVGDIANASWAIYFGFEHQFAYANGPILPNITRLVRFTVDATKVNNFGVELRATDSCAGGKVLSLPGGSAVTIDFMPPYPIQKPKVCQLAIRICAVPINPIFDPTNACY